MDGRLLALGATALLAGAAARRGRGSRGIGDVAASQLDPKLVARWASRFEHASEWELRAEDLDWSFAWVERDRLDGLVRTFVPSSQVRNLKQAWRTFIEQEIAADPGYYEAMRAWWRERHDRDVKPIYVVADDDGTIVELWDGWHRTGFAYLDDYRRIPAFVGRLRKGSAAASGAPLDLLHAAKFLAESNSNGGAVEVLAFLIEQIRRGTKPEAAWRKAYRTFGNQADEAKYVHADADVMIDEGDYLQMVACDVEDLPPEVQWVIGRSSGRHPDKGGRNTRGNPSLAGRRRGRSTKRGSRSGDPTASEIRAWARAYEHDNNVTELRAQDLDWRLERLPRQAFAGMISDNAQKGPAAAWKAWAREELQYDPGYRTAQRTWWKRAVTTDEEPVFAVVDDDGRVIDLWEGWHRVGFSWLDGHPTIPTYVGRRRGGSAARSPMRTQAPQKARRARMRARERRGSGARDPDPARPFLGGWCGELAAVLHRRTGWPIKIAWARGPREEGMFLHAFCVPPQIGMVADARGVRPLAAMHRSLSHPRGTRVFIESGTVQDLDDLSTEGLDVEMMARAEAYLDEYTVRR